MALVERLCQINPGEPGGEPYERHIALNDFEGAIFSVLGGYETVAQVKAFYDMTPEDEVELDVFIARITNYPQKVDRLNAAHRIRAILLRWEKKDEVIGSNQTPGFPGYTTVAEIRAALNQV